jgi:SAM-dependent MidA family methyltransferase
MIMSVESQNRLEEVLVGEIARHGPLPFARFVELALYHPASGYYMGGRSKIQGKGGDFYTSPQVSSLFGEVLAGAFISMWKTLGSPRFSLIELGAGEGLLAADVLDALAKKGMTRGLSLTVVEKDPIRLSAALRRLSRFSKVSGVTDPAQLDEDHVFDGCVFSNEFVDAIPFHRLVNREGVWREVAVTWSAGRFEEVLISPTVPLPEGLPTAEGEIRGLLYRPQAGGWLEKSSELISRGYVLTIDYGSGRAAYWDPRRSGDQWGCFREHRFDKDPYTDIGRKDITADVEFTSLLETGLASGLEPLYFNTQASFLLTAGRRIWESLNGHPKMEIQLAAQHLLHPSGLGEAFQVFLQGKKAPLPEFLLGASNRLKRLQWVAPSDKIGMKLEEGV